MSGPLRILVTGSRDWQDQAAIHDALVHVFATITTIGAPVLVHGGQVSQDPRTGELYGADHLADQAWRAIADQRPGWLSRPEVHEAEWAAPCRAECKPGHRRRNRRSEEYCPAQGNYRNQAMVDAGADVCLAFPLPQSRGTRDCVRRARAAGIRVVEHQAVRAT